MTAVSGPEEQAAGQGKVYYNEPAEYKVKLFFRNKYGVYSSGYVNFKVEQ